MISLIPIPFLAVTVPLLVRARFRNDRNQEVLFKPLSTLEVIAVALLSFGVPGRQIAFTLGIALGLVLSLGGDVALIFRSNRTFLIGLVFFLLAHIVYSVVFTVLNGFHRQDLISGAVLLALAIPIYLYLRPGLGRLNGPVIVYILVICFMVNRAISAFWSETFSQTQAWLMSTGALLFWLSDLMLAINRFRCPFRAESLSLFLYYGGQLLIALSPSFF
ncbi:MAG: lysoplasmalogenase [Anaerolineae bacterium]